jgi:hypothetical protein
MMRERLYRQLQQLEKTIALSSKQDEHREAEANSARARRRVELFLRVCGIQHRPQESLVEALARALEITCRELRALLAAGIDPVHRYFAERGIYEALQTKKAAGGTVGTMRLETKYLRLRTSVTIGSRFGDWNVCWLGGWTRHRLSYLVMAVRLPGAEQHEQNSLTKARTAGGAAAAGKSNREDLADRQRSQRRGPPGDPLES